VRYAKLLITLKVEASHRLKFVKLALFFFRMRAASLCCCLLSSAPLAAAAPWQEVALEQSQKLFEEKKFAQAETVLKKVPASCARNILLGRVKANLGALDQAEALYLACLNEFEPDHADAQTALAKLYTYQKKFKEAEESYKQVLQSAPTNIDAYIGAARAAKAQNKEATAADYYERALAVNASHPLLWFDLGVMSAGQNDIEAAQTRFAKAQQLNPALDMAVVGRVHASFAQYPSAAAAYEQAVQACNKTGDDAIQLYLTYGQVLELLHQDERALALYYRALEVNSDSPHAHMLVASALTGTGINNLGAQKACGLNSEEAMQHYAAAAVSVDAAKEALSHCKAELQEAAAWRERAVEMTKNGAKRSSSAAPKKLREQEPDWVKALGGYMSLPRVEIDSAEQLWAEHVSTSTPAVITNFQDKFAPAADWSWDALHQRFGDDLVHGTCYWLFIYCTRSY
jgi:tetratricopeptide (TPR) repeat protein